MQRLATNACPRLDVFQLHRAGALTNGAVTKWVWVLPAFSLTVTARAEAHRLMLSVNDGLDTSAAITGVPATLGNTYPYFACTACDRLVRYLYVQNEHIACRRCQNLEFASRQPGQWRTTSRQIARLRAQLAALEAKALDERPKRRQSVKRFQEVSP